MKIVHICLANSVWDESYAYQDNLLPIYHRRMGHDVTIFAPTSARFDNKGGYIVKSPGVSILSNGIKLIRVKPIIANYRINNHIHLFHSIYKDLEIESPDLIFVHDPSIVNNLCLVKYKRKHPDVRIVFDNHSDLINSDKNILSKFRDYVFARYFIVRKMIKVSDIFYGTTPGRCDYLAEVFNVPKHKIKLLVMGADDEEMNINNREIIRKQIREKYGVKENDFLLVTGGKIDKDKNVHLLAEAISAIENKNLRLMIFGNIHSDVESIIDSFGDERIIKIGWITSNRVYDYMYAADLAVFTGLHSVLWEQTVASCVPCLFSKLKGFEHVDIGGNALFFENRSIDCYKDVISKVIEDKELYTRLKRCANVEAANSFLYSRIAKQVVEDAFHNQL
ncbi:MAG: glycosyltransferase family 4 protein [Alistipes sp.]|nr:glycosyltransferase family 4 protein [Alistipes sp.]